MKDNCNFLGTEPVGPLLRRLALPTVAAQIINMLYNIVDRIYIGHIPGDGVLALTGVGVCMPLIMVVTAFAAFAASGGAPRASIFMGKGDKESAEKTLGNCLTLQIIISVILTVVLLVYSRPVLLLFGASENTIGYATSYMNLYALGTVFTLKAQIKAKRQELDDLNIQVQTYEEANDSLREQLQNGLTDEDISELARTKLNYAEPGERVFVDTSSR